jgi:hypothetical protein
MSPMACRQCDCAAVHQIAARCPIVGGRSSETSDILQTLALDATAQIGAFVKSKLRNCARPDPAPGFLIDIAMKSNFLVRPRTSMPSPAVR